MDPPRPVTHAARPAWRRCRRRPGSFDWSTTGRDDTEAESDDRKSVELVQEIRVAQIGVQVLFTIVLGIAFAPGFAMIGDPQEVAYVAALVLSATAAGVLLAQVMYHHRVFRRKVKARLGAPVRADVAGLVAEISDLEREIQQTSVYPARGSSSEINDDLIDLMVREYVVLAELSHRLDGPAPTDGHP